VSSDEIYGKKISFCREQQLYIIGVGLLVCSRFTASDYAFGVWNISVIIYIFKFIFVLKRIQLPRYNWNFVEVALKTINHNHEARPSVVVLRQVIIFVSYIIVRTCYCCWWWWWWWWWWWSLFCTIDQHSEMDFCSASLLKQQYTDSKYLTIEYTLYAYCVDTAVCILSSKLFKRYFIAITDKTP
jgi:hypothetical protein